MLTSVKEDITNCWEFSWISWKLVCLYFWGEYSCNISKTSSSKYWSSPHSSFTFSMNSLSCVHQYWIDSREGYWRLKCLWNIVWKSLREYKLPNGNPSYHDLSFSSKIILNSFIKESSCHPTPSLCIWLWNINKWMAASSPFWSLNIGRYVFKSRGGIQFG